MIVNNSIMFQTQIYCCKVFQNYTESEIILPCILLDIYHIKTLHVKDTHLSDYLSNSVAPEPKGSSPHSQQPNDPYPEQGECTPQPPPPQPISLRSILISSSHLRLGLSSGPFPSGFPIKTLYTYLPSLMRATCPAHLILLD
jgi:hypothetical protein